MRNLIEITNYLWEYLLYMSCILCIFLVAYFSLSDHKINRYYLASSNGTNITNLSIKIDIDWCYDKTIDLDRTITYEQAVDLVNKLNSTLK